MDVRQLLDREEIRALKLAYGRFLDEHRLDPLVALFAEDAVCEFGERYGGPWRGRAAIREGYARVLSRGGEPLDAVHLLTNPVLELTGPDVATGRWYLTEFRTRQEPGRTSVTRGGHDAPLLYLGVYDDEYRRVDGAWRLSRTRLTLLWPERD